jgi:hypothetical protein
MITLSITKKISIEKRLIKTQKNDNGTNSVVACLSANRIHHCDKKI